MVRHFQPRLIIETGSGLLPCSWPKPPRKNQWGNPYLIDRSAEISKGGVPWIRSANREKKRFRMLIWNSSRTQSGDILLSTGSHTSENWRGRQLSFPGNPATHQARCHCACPRHLFAVRLSARLGDGGISLWTDNTCYRHFLPLIPSLRYSWLIILSRYTSGSESDFPTSNS